MLTTLAVMFGGLQPDVMGHEKVPVIKLIDFGEAGQNDEGPNPRDFQKLQPAARPRLQREGAGGDDDAADHGH